MPTADRERMKLWGVWALLIVQIALFYKSMDAMLAIGVFCTAGNSLASTIFTIIHITYVALFFAGLLALRIADARTMYLSVTSVLLLALPVQHAMVLAGYLSCDGP